MKSVNSYSSTASSSSDNNSNSNRNLIVDSAASQFLLYTNSLLNNKNLTNEEINYLNKRKYVAQWQPKQNLSNNHESANDNDNKSPNNNDNNNNTDDKKIFSNYEESLMKRKKIKISRASSPLSTSSCSSSSSLSHSSSNQNFKHFASYEEQQSPNNYQNQHVLQQFPTINIKSVSHFNISFNNNNDKNYKNGTDKNNNQQLVIKLKSNYMTHFISNLTDYIIEKMPFDLCLVTNNNKNKLNVHKLMLSNASNFFKRRIDQLKNIKNNDEIDCLELTQVDNFECLEICIKFVYMGGSQLDIINLDLIEDLKNTAKLLELNDLVGLCDMINANIETKNFVMTKRIIKTNSSSPSFDNSLSFSSTNNNNNNNNGNTSGFITNSRGGSGFKKYESLSNPNNLNICNSATSHVDDQTNSNNMISSKIIQLLLNSSQQLQGNIWQQQYGNEFSPHHFLNSFLQITNTNQNNTNKFHSNNSNKKTELNNSSFENEKIKNHDDKNYEQKISRSPLNNSNDETKFKQMLKTKLEKYQRINNEGHDLFDLLDVSKNVRDYLFELFTVALTLKNKSSIELDMEIDTLNRDLIIKDKYIYPIMFTNILGDTKKNDIEKKILFNNQLNECFENYTYINLFNSCSNLLNSLNLLKQGVEDFYKQSLIIFSLSIGENNHFKFNNYIIQEKLNFTDLNVLKEDIRKSLDTFLNDYVMNKLNLKNDSNNASISSASSSFLTQINNVFYLKKPSNCKTIKLEEIKTSTDCFRALVEYSRVNALNEKPYVLVTIKANITLSINQK